MNFIDKILKEADIYDQKIKNPDTGREIKVSTALGYDETDAVYKKAKALVNKGGTKTVKKDVPKEKPTKEKNAKSHKPKSNSYGVSKECVQFLQSKGYGKLNAYPQSFVKPSEITFNPLIAKKGPDSTWVAKFPTILPNGNKAVKTAYTANFMKKSQVLKYKKISKIKEADITNLEVKTNKLLSHKDPRIADAAAVIKIILKTGLRVGSKDGEENSTGNLGVRTLKKDNVKINGDKITLKFIGKSYQENNAEFKDKEVAEYLTKKINSGSDNLFDCSYGLIGTTMEHINPKKINPKDLRTYKATKYAKDLCNNAVTAIKGQLKKDGANIKKIVKEHLADIFEKVSIILNNSPAMAKNSYVHPVVITDFLSNLQLKPKEVGYKHVTLESKKYLKESEENISTMDSMFEKYSDYGNGVDLDIDPQEADNCDEFILPEWYWNDEIELCFI